MKQFPAVVLSPGRIATFVQAEETLAIQRPTFMLASNEIRVVYSKGIQNDR